MKRSALETALVEILGRLKGIAPEDLSTAERQIQAIARKALGDKVAKDTLRQVRIHNNLSK